MSRRRTRGDKVDDNIDGTRHSHRRTRSNSDDGKPNSEQILLGSPLSHMYEDSIKHESSNRKSCSIKEVVQHEECSNKELAISINENKSVGKESNDQYIVKSLKFDDKTIKLTITTLTNKFDCAIGVKNMSTKIDRKSRTRRTVGQVESYHEDKLMEKCEQKCWEELYMRKSRPKNIPSKLVENSPRKRSISERSNQSIKEACKEYGVDENEMSHANQILSPTKRPKSETKMEQTPKKTITSKELKGTPRSTAKRKINLSETITSKNVEHDAGIDKERSSSDESMSKHEKLKEAKIVLLKESFIQKRTNQSSKNNYKSESEESNDEMHGKNHDDSNFKSKLRSRIKSVQTPTKKLETPSFSPSKGMQNLNLNKKHATLVEFSTKRHELKHALSDEEEEADSSDSFQPDESELDESESDSAEETQTRKRNKIISNTQRKNVSTPKASRKINKISLDTPTKGISRMSLGTPSMDKHRRTISIVKPSTPLQEARAKLHVSVLPKSLPCREEQFNDIYSFLHARLSDGSGGCIYISGVPGTGKTATVNEVICCLKKSVKKGELSEFEFIDINGMRMSEPRQTYVQIWKQLTGETKTWEESHKLLHNRFTNSNSKQRMMLLLVDELDLLCTKRQDVVYNLLDWPSKTNAKLVVVTIANTMDLPERILMGKVTSRLGLTRLTFPPYNFKQLEEIVVSRLKGFNAFSGETIELVARKVASVSGDARRALDICRRATEIAEENNREIVSMIDVKQALDEMIASPKIQAIQHCSDMEKIFLKAVCAEVQRTGLEEVVFQNVYMHMGTLCSMDAVPTPNESEALEMCARLGSWRLLLCDHSRLDIHQRLLLNVSTDDVHFATQNIKE